MDTRPWYRESWLWFVIALPLAAVIAGISTVIIASSGDDALVVDDFRKVGLVARRETAREHEAARRQIRATVAIDRRSGIVTVRLEGDAAPDALQLGLFHPTRRDMDRETRLVRDAAGLYRGSIGTGVVGHGYVQIADAVGAWRVTGRIGAGDSLLRLEAKP